MRSTALLCGCGWLLAATPAGAQECDPASFFGTAEESIFGTGEVERLRTCLSERPDVLTMVDAEGRTVLHAAAEKARSGAAIRLLLDAGADPNARSATGETPLFDVAKHNRNAAVAEALLGGGADPAAEDDHNPYSSPLTPLYFAVRNENPPVIGPLVQAGADVNQRVADHWRITFLHLAALWNRNPETARALLAAGADPNARDPGGATPLHSAAMNRWKAPVVGLLLEAGTEMPPLHAAALTGDAGAAAALLSAGTDPNLADGAGWSALHFAASRNMPEIVTLLLDAGADPNAALPYPDAVPPENGFTPLHIAVVTASRLGVVCALLEGGANPNRTAGPDTPLHFAAWVRTPEVVRALLDAGADPGIKGSKGYTPADRARGNRAIEESDVFERLRAGGSMPNSSLQRPIC